MSDPSPPFSWLTFLLGFAIALWLAVVVLFILPDKKPPPSVIVQHEHAGEATHLGPRRKPVKPMWIPAGPDPMFCTNTDGGGGYVEDAGGGYVEDGGGGYVDDGGGGYVDDSHPKSPAPSIKHEGLAREDKQYHCETTDGGGGYVEDSSGRSVTRPMLTDPRFGCWKDSAKNAVVVLIDRSSETPIYTRTDMDRRGRVVLHDEVKVEEADLALLPADTVRTAKYLYCIVAESARNPVILNRNGENKGETSDDEA